MAISKIASAGITADFDNSLTTADLAPNSVDSSELVDGSIDTSHLSNNIAISTSGAITTTGAFTSVGIDDNASGANAITINSSERVGIGSTAPLANTKLEIKDADHASLLLHDSDAATTKRIVELRSQGESFFIKGRNDDNTGAGAAGTILSASLIVGNIAIGKASPSVGSHLDVGNTTTYNNIGKSVIRIGSINNTGVYALYGTGWGGGGTYSPVTFGGLGSSGSGSVKAHFVINTRDSTSDVVPTERFRITDSGNCGIGATSPGARLQVGASNLSGYSAVFTNGNNNTNYWGIKILAGLDNDTNSIFLSAFNGSGGVTGYLRTNSSGVFYLDDTSDERLKKEIVDSDVDGYSIINQLTLRKFKWKISDIKVDLGLVANEVISIYPEAVNGEVDAVNEDGSIDPITISMGAFVPVLLKGFQQMTEKVEALETKVTTLETKVTALENA